MAFWGEAVTTAVYLLNRVPTKSVVGKTPFEAWHGHKPTVEHLRVFGCLAYVKVTCPHLKKLDDRSVAMVFIGYEPSVKAWRFYDPVAQRVHVSRDTVFQEHESWDWSKVYNDVKRNSKFVIDYAVEEIVSSPDASSPLPGHGAPTPSPAGAPTPPPAFVSPPPNAREYLNSDNDDVTPRYRAVDNVLGPATSPGFAPRDINTELFLQIGEEPALFAEAVQHESWRQAMKEEMDAIESNGTWHLEALPAGHRAIGLKWVFKVKKNIAGEIIKCKARLVAKGYVQQ
jgi:hypothetical protein